MDSSTHSLRPSEDLPSLVGHSSQLSNLGHLGLIKGQRNVVSGQLKAQQAANAEQKRSVAALRKLAFRLAVRIQVKETSIAQQARSLANSRKAEYLKTRGHDARIAELSSTLAFHEQRNRELLENLERAAQLTLHYPTPSPQAGPSNGNHYFPSHPAVRPALPSPPPSPQVRNASPHRKQSSRPHTPTNDSLSELVEVRTANERLIKAKRESDHALLVCRSRIAALQEDAEHNKDNVRLLEKTKVDLEETISKYRSKVEVLERLKSELEQDLEATQSKLDSSATSEVELKAELESKQRRIAELEAQYDEARAHISELEKDKAALEQEVIDSRAEIETLSASKRALEDQLKASQKKLEENENSTRSLQEEIDDKEAEVAGQETRIRTLDRSISFFEETVQEYVGKIETLDATNKAHEKELRAAQASKLSVEQDLSILLESKVELEELLKHTNDSKIELQQELEEAQNAMSGLQKEIKAIRSNLSNTLVSFAQSHAKVRELEASQKKLEKNLLQAQQDLADARQANPEAEAELNFLRISKVQVETELKELKQSTLGLREDLEATQANLMSMERSKADLLVKLEHSEKSRAGLQEEVQSVEKSKAQVQEHLRSALRSKENLEEDLRANQSRLLMAETSEVNLQAKLSVAEMELAALRKTNEDLEQTELALQNRLSMAESELHAVRAANDELEAFLTEAEQGMEIADLAVQDSEKKVDQFVTEGNAKINAAQESKEKYKQKLLETRKEINELHDVNLNLATKLEQKDLDIESLQKAEAALAEEIESKDHWIHDLEQTNTDFASSVEAIENELKILRETKATFEAVVASLQEKNAHLELLNEWCDPPSEAPSIRGSTPPRPRRLTTDSKERPLSSCSVRTTGTTGTRHTTEEELNDWAAEIERVRMLRDETAIQLSGLKNTKSSLKKIMKAADKELQHLEKDSSNSTRNVLKKKFGMRSSSASSNYSHSARPTTPASETKRNWLGFKVHEKPKPRAPSTSHGPSIDSRRADVYTSTSSHSHNSHHSHNASVNSDHGAGRFDPLTRTWVTSPPLSRQHSRKISTQTTSTGSAAEPPNVPRTVHNRNISGNALSVASSGGSGAEPPNVPRTRSQATTRSKEARFSTDSSVLEEWDDETKSWLAQKDPTQAQVSAGKAGPVGHYDPETRTWTVQAKKNNNNNSRTSANKQPPKKGKPGRDGPVGVYDPETRQWIGTRTGGRRSGSSTPRSGTSTPSTRSDPPPVGKYNPQTRKWEYPQATVRPSAATGPVGTYNPETRQWELPKKGSKSGSVGTYNPETRQWELPKAKSKAPKEDPVGTFDPVTRTWSTAAQQPKKEEPVPKADEPVGEYDPETRTWKTTGKTKFPTVAEGPAPIYDPDWRPKRETNSRPPPPNRAATPSVEEIIGEYDPDTRTWNPPKRKQSPPPEQRMQHIESQAGPRTPRANSILSTASTEPQTRSRQGSVASAAPGRYKLLPSDPPNPMGTFDPETRQWIVPPRSSSRYPPRNSPPSSPPPKNPASPPPPESHPKVTVMARPGASNRIPQLGHLLPPQTPQTASSADPAGGLGVYDPIVPAIAKIRLPANKDKQEQQTPLSSAAMDPAGGLGVYDPESKRGNNSAASFEDVSGPPSTSGTDKEVGTFDPVTRTWITPGGKSMLGAGHVAPPVEPKVLGRAPVVRVKKKSGFVAKLKGGWQKAKKGY